MNECVLVGACSVCFLIFVLGDRRAESYGELVTYCWSINLLLDLENDPSSVD